MLKQKFHCYGPVFSPFILSLLQLVTVDDTAVDVEAFEALIEKIVDRELGLL